MRPGESAHDVNEETSPSVRKPRELVLPGLKVALYTAENWVSHLTHPPSRDRHWLEDRAIPKLGLVGAGATVRLAGASGAFEALDEDCGDGGLGHP